MKKNNIKNLIYSFVLFPLVFTFYPLYEDNSLENNSSNITMQKDKNKDYTIEQISAGSSHSAAVVNNKGTDELYTWGENGNGQLGLGDTEDRKSPTLVEGLPDGDIEQISMGSNHSAAVINNNGTDELWTWGNNSDGQLGTGRTSDPSPIPIKVKTELQKGSEIEQISLGANYSAVVVNNGEKDKLYTWGKNDRDQLGLDDDVNHKYPTLVSFPSAPEYTEINDISMGNSHSAAIVDDELYTWGTNTWGQIGNDSQEDQSIPLLINIGNYPIQEVSLGNGYSVAIVEESDNENSIYTWGNNNYGQLGNNDTHNKNVLTPTRINLPVGKNAKQICAGENSAATIDNEGNLYTWGDNESGGLGQGDEVEATHPTKVEYFSNNQQLVKAVSMGNDFSIAIVEENGNDYLYTWGENDKGQLGLGDNENDNTPQLVKELSYQKPSFVQQWYFYVIIVIAIIFLIALALISVIIIRKKHAIA